MRAALALLGLLLSTHVFASTCYVTEFSERPPVTYQAAYVPALVNQTITFTTASVQSAAFDYRTQLVRIQCDAPAWAVFGASPTATLSALKLTTGQTEYFTVTGNSSLKVAVIGQ